MSADHVPHEYGPSRVGHGEAQCKWCLGTNRENAIIAPNHCEERAKALSNTPERGGPSCELADDGRKETGETGNDRPATPASLSSKERIWSDAEVSAKLDFLADDIESERVTASDALWVRDAAERLRLLERLRVSASGCENCMEVLDRPAPETGSHLHVGVACDNPEDCVSVMVGGRKFIPETAAPTKVLSDMRLEWGLGCYCACPACLALDERLREMIGSHAEKTNELHPKGASLSYESEDGQAVGGTESAAPATSSAPAEGAPLPGAAENRIGDPCPTCGSGRIGQSGYNIRCANCGWLGPRVSWAPGSPDPRNGG